LPKIRFGLLRGRAQSQRERQDHQCSRERRKQRPRDLAPLGREVDDQPGEEGSQDPPAPPTPRSARRRAKPVAACRPALIFPMKPAEGAKFARKANVHFSPPGLILIGAFKSKRRPEMKFHNATTDIFGHTKRQR